MIIGENYEGKITLVRSDISRFSRGTDSSTGRRKRFNVFMLQDSRKQAGITTFLNC
jgi:hypothetical protein